MVAGVGLPGLQISGVGGRSLLRQLPETSRLVGWQQKLQFQHSRRRKQPSCTCALEAFESLLHNKVLMAGSLACGGAQFLKPFAAAIAGRGFDPLLAIKSGGMPSSHAAVVTAVAVTVGLDRGLDDAVFGACLIGACIVMYDAQGVRYAVGKQAEFLNEVVAPQLESRQTLGASTSTVFTDAFQAGRTSSNARGKERMEQPFATPVALAEGEDLAELAYAFRSPGGSQEIDIKVVTGRGWRHLPLKESVGHSKLEVLVGATFGLILACILPH